MCEMETHFSEKMSGPTLEHRCLGMERMSESSQTSCVEALARPPYDGTRARAGGGGGVPRLFRVLSLKEILQTCQTAANKKQISPFPVWNVVTAAVNCLLNLAHPDSF